MNGTDTIDRSVGRSVDARGPVDHDSVGLAQARPNYFRTRSVVNKVHPVGKDSGDESGGLHCFYRQKDNRIQAGSL